MPYDFFMSRYKEAYVQETLAFVDALVNDKPAPCTGEVLSHASLLSITHPPPPAVLLMAASTHTPRLAVRTAG